MNEVSVAVRIEDGNKNQRVSRSGTRLNTSLGRPGVAGKTTSGAETAIGCVALVCIRTLGTGRK